MVAQRAWNLVVVAHDAVELDSFRRIFPELDVGGRFYGASSAADAMEHIAQLRASPHGLAILADHRLGRGPLSGIDVLREARMRRPDSLRMLMGDEPPQEIAQAILAGDVHAFFEKPNVVRPLAQLLRR
jgi:DNA-binding NtrC family response regulator